MTGKSPSLTDKFVACRVRLRRLQMGLSQEELAHALGITFQQVQKYEKGTNRISAGRLYDIAQLLDVPLQYFYEDGSGEGESAMSEEARRANEIMTAPWAVNLVKVLKKFDNPDIWKALTHLAVVIFRELDKAQSDPHVRQRIEKELFGQEMLEHALFVEDSFEQDSLEKDSFKKSSAFVAREGMLKRRSG